MKRSIINKKYQGIVSGLFLIDMKPCSGRTIHIVTIWMYSWPLDMSLLWLIVWVLRRFQQLFSYITAFPGCVYMYTCSRHTETILIRLHKVTKVVFFLWCGLLTFCFKSLSMPSLQEYLYYLVEYPAIPSTYTSCKTNQDWLFGVLRRFQQFFSYIMAFLGKGTSNTGPFILTPASHS